MVLQDTESNSNANGLNFRAVLEHSIEYLCNESNFGQLQALTAKQYFCWTLVESFCSCIRVVPDHFEWLHKYSYVITKLHNIFKSYCRAMKLSGKESIYILENALPVIVQTSDDVKRSVYKLNLVVYINVICVSMWVHHGGQPR